MPIEKTIRDNFAEILLAYSKATREPLSTISRRFYGNSDFLEKFIAGDATISLKALDKVVDKMREKWPPRAIWPMTRTISMDFNEKN